MKALFHIDESSRWDMTLGNTANMLAYGDATATAFETEIVVNGPAVKELQENALNRQGILNRLETLAKRVRVCACNNALKANGIAPGSLPAFVQVVPAGVVEIVLRQADGFAYIKP